MRETLFRLTCVLLLFFCKGAGSSGRATQGPPKEVEEDDLPECFRQHILEDPNDVPANANIGPISVDLLGIMGDFELKKKAVDEVFHVFHKALGNKNFPSSVDAALKALGIDNDISYTERHFCKSCSQHVYPPPDLTDPDAPSLATQEGRRRLHGCGMFPCPGLYQCCPYCFCCLPLLRLDSASCDRLPHSFCRCLRRGRRHRGVPKVQCPKV